MLKEDMLAKGSKYATLLALLGVAAGLTACGHVARDPEVPTRGAAALGARSLAPLTASSSRAKVRGGSPDEEALLAEIVAGVGKSSVSRVTIGAVPDGWQQAEAIEAVGDKWLVIEVESEHLGAAQVRASWEASLVAGAFRDRAHASRLGDVLGFSTILHYPDGTSRRNDRLMTGAFAHDVDDRGASAIADGIRARLEAAAEEMGGIHRATVSFRRPLAFAVILELEAVDVRKAAAYSSRNDLFGNVEGRLLQLGEADGTPVLVSGSAKRSRAGKLWIRREYARY